MKDAPHSSLQMDSHDIFKALRQGGENTYPITVFLDQSGNVVSWKYGENQDKEGVIGYIATAVIKSIKRGGEEKTINSYDYAKVEISSQQSISAKSSDFFDREGIRRFADIIKTLQEKVNHII